MAKALTFLLLSSLAFAQLGEPKVKLVPSPNVTLTCSAPSGGQAPTSYNFYRGTVTGGPYTKLGGNPTCAYTDATVLYSTTYFYVATAVSGTYESGYSNQTTAVIPVNPTPNPPTGLAVTQIVAGMVPLGWTAPQPQQGITVASYTVWRGSQPTLPSPSKIATVKVTNYTDHGCKKAACFYYVRAVDSIAGKQVVTGPSNIVKGGN